MCRFRLSVYIENGLSPTESKCQMVTVGEMNDLPITDDEKRINWSKGLISLPSHFSFLLSIFLSFFFLAFCISFFISFFSKNSSHSHRLCPLSAQTFNNRTVNYPDWLRSSFGLTKQRTQNWKMSWRFLNS